MIRAGTILGVIVAAALALAATAAAAGKTPVPTGLLGLCPGRVPFGLDGAEPGGGVTLHSVQSLPQGGLLVCRGGE